MFRAALVIAIVGAFAASAAFGADANAPAEPKPAPKAKPMPMTIKGMVSVVKDVNGVVTAVKLTSEMKGKKMEHNLVLDKEGMELARWDGKEVEAKVMRSGPDYKVLSFKEVEKAEGKPEEKPKEKPVEQPKAK
jgi:hypothetical protein